jgi:DNA-binding GntR family transcriptional regulator
MLMLSGLLTRWKGRGWVVSKGLYDCCWWTSKSYVERVCSLNTDKTERWIKE